MKNKQIQSTFLPIFFFCLCLAFLGFGCLGGGGGGGTGSSINPNSDLSLTGRAYFKDRKIYGNIPIVVKNLQKETVAITTTDSSGNYAFSNLEPGTYYVSATTGESEVTFGNMIQVTGRGATELTPTSLLSINNLVIDQITTDSFHIVFNTNQSCKSYLKYKAVGDYETSLTVSQNSKTKHETTVKSLSFLTNYEIEIDLAGDDGQEFVLNGVTAYTIGLSGCSNLSVSINNGSFETNNRTVTLYLNADDCDQMRIGEDYSLDDATWVSYSPLYTYNFKDTSTGIKRIYVQFKSKGNIVSTIQSDSIVYSSSGYLGIWINDGEALTNKTNSIIKAICPGASQMILSDNPDFTGAFWEPYTSTRKWQLTNVDGLQSIYCKFKGEKINSDDVFSTSIVYDSTPPKAEVVINGGESYIATTSVTLHFTSTSLPSYMKISNDAAPEAFQEWIPYKTELEWSLSPNNGQKSVYVLFKDDAGNEYGPIAAVIVLDTVAPTGNSIYILNTNKFPDKTPTSISEVSATNLPVYLHFEVSDSSTYKAHYCIVQGTETQPIYDNFTDVLAPFNCVQLNKSSGNITGREIYKYLKTNKNYIWVYFSDEAGNKSYAEKTEFTVDGPELVISPSSVTLTSGQEYTFNLSSKNIDLGDVTQTQWSVVNVSSITGDIDISSGRYTAPSPLFKEHTVTINCNGISSLDSSNVEGSAKVILKRSVELAYSNEIDGIYTKELLAKQIRPNEECDYFVCSISPQGVESQGIKPTSPLKTEYGSFSISTKDEIVKNEKGSITTIHYKAKDNIVGQKTDELTFQVVDVATVTGKVTCIISNGANITITPDSYIAQRNDEKIFTITAEIQNSTANKLKWKIHNEEAGSFNKDKDNVFETNTEGSHVVFFYPKTPTKIIQTSISASLEDDSASKSVNISVYPPISFEITPIATSAMPLDYSMLFNVESFNFFISGTNEGLDWKFKNANSDEFMPADSKTYTDRGSLTGIYNYQVQYKRPTDLPSKSNSTASDVILIQATSVYDKKASSTAVVKLVEPVTVKIYDEIEKVNEISTAATVIEVGTLQFYAKVEPEIIGNTSVSWTVNGVKESDLYGKIDSNGKYTAPSTYDANRAIIRATSNYDPTKYAEVEVSLNEFWVPKREGMVDRGNGMPMTISKVFVDPTTEEGQDFVVYAGTAAENQFGYYGLYWATFSSEPGNTTSSVWQGVTDLSVSDQKPVNNLKYLIYDIAMDGDKNLYVSTGAGIYYVSRYIQNNPSNKPTATPLTGWSFHSSPITAIETGFDPDNNSKMVLFAGCDDGVYMLRMSSKTAVSSAELLIDTQHSYKTDEVRDNIITETDDSTEPPTVITRTEPFPSKSYLDTENPILSTVRSVKFNTLSRALFLGTASGKVYYCPTLAPNMTKVIDGEYFAKAAGIETTNGDFYIYNRIGYPNSGSVIGVPLAIASDKVNPNTLWVATTKGIERSTDYGITWEQRVISGNNTNCRCILVDPNNTINVMSGSEDGLYRSVDGGTTWTRIRSGLGNYKTITSLTQAPGAAGKRRKVWVGTSGGVFVGKESLALE